MTENDTFSVMRRKAGAGRPPPEISQITANSALRMALAQAAEDVFGLTASVTSIKESRVTLATFLEGVPQKALLTLCERGGDERGLIILDQESLSALIEIQTIGKVSSNPTAPRPPTRTDAFLCAGFFDQTLLLFEEAAFEADLTITPTISGYRYAMPLPDMRAVEMTLTDCPYHLFTLGIDFASGAKSGQMLILLPFIDPVSNRNEVNHEWEANLVDVVSCTHVEIEAVLARKELQLSEIAAFEVGSIITIPSKSVGEVRLIDMNGANITSGRLGRTAGMRAICIMHPCNKSLNDEPDFVTPSMVQAKSQKVETLVETVKELPLSTEQQSTSTTIAPDGQSGAVMPEALTGEIQTPDLENA